MTDAIILFAHGSLLCGSGQALEAHAERLRSLGLAREVRIGYLNYTAPAFADVLSELAGAGARSVIVAPYFLVAGYFVKVELARCLEAARAAHPDLQLRVADPIGYDSRLAEALISSACSALPAPEWDRLLAEATSFCRAEAGCPLRDRPECPAARGSRANPQPREPSREPIAETGLDPGEAALLVLVHGSPRPPANADMYRTVERARDLALFKHVEVGFLECNQPTIADAIDLCANRDVRWVLAVPYFLHTGTHVAEDLPGLLREGEARHPGVTFRLGSYLGASERVTDVLADRIRCAT